MILLTSTIWLLFILYRAHNDSWLIKNGIQISHAENAICSIIFACSLSWNAIGSLWLVPVYLCVYWILFDIALNKFRGKELLYLGTTAFLDRIFIRPWIQLTVKIACLVVGVYGWLIIGR